MELVTGKVVHCKKEKFDVYIGRNKDGLGEWGNPFPLLDPKDDKARDEVYRQYCEWVLQQPKLMNNLHTLRGKTLGCWCAPRLCHGDFLSYLANDIPGTVKVIVAGSRGFNNYKELEERLDEFVKDYNDVIIISGMADGADRMGYDYAKSKGYLCIPMPALWRDDAGNFNRGAGFIRNGNMVAIANAAIYFWDGFSKGTNDCIRKATKANLKVNINIYPESYFNDRTN